jgi:hypothetical protein
MLDQLWLEVAGAEWLDEVADAEWLLRRPNLAAIVCSTQ